MRIGVSRARDGAALKRGSRRRRPSGQSLVEFAITFPVVLLMVLFGIDFGRVFLGWVTLNNAVREAANYASINPSAWLTPGNPAARAAFDAMLRAETDETRCALPAGDLPDPAFPGGTGIGAPAVVAVTCQFELYTPMMKFVVGNPLDVSASAAFPIRSGSIPGTPGGGGSLPSIGPVLPSGLPGSSSSPGPQPSAVTTPVPMCSVPDFKNTNTSAATGTWTGAGFTASSLVFNPLVGPGGDYVIKDQSLAKNASVPCTSSITVYDKAGGH